MARLIHPDGTEDTVKPSNGSKFYFEELLRILEGDFERRRFENITLISESESSSHKNVKATEMAGLAIFGKCLVCDHHEV